MVTEDYTHSIAELRQDSLLQELDGLTADIRTLETVTGTAEFGSVCALVIIAVLLFIKRNKIRGSIVQLISSDRDWETEF